MKRLIKTAFLLIPLLTANVWAENAPTNLSCSDFRLTPDAEQRFPDLRGACESVVERDGELYGLFRAVVRRAGFRSVTLYLPATDHTFVVNPQPDARVLVGNTKVMPRDLSRGQEIRIYLSVAALAEPNVEEIALVTETEVIIPHSVAAVESLPTTASIWPAIGLGSLILLALGWVIRQLRLILGVIQNEQ